MPYSVCWVRGEQEEVAEVEVIDTGILDPEEAVVTAIHAAKSLPPKFGGGRVIVSDEKGDRLAAIATPFPAVVS